MSLDEATLKALVSTGRLSRWLAHPRGTLGKAAIGFPIGTIILQQCTVGNYNHNLIYAIRTLAEWSGQEAANFLNQEASTSPSLAVRKEAVEALAVIGGVEATNFLLVLATDPGKDVRRTALDGLADLLMGGRMVWDQSGIPPDLNGVSKDVAQKLLSLFSGLPTEHIEALKQVGK